MREYQFKGELAAVSGMMRLTSRIKQKKLAPTVLDQIWSEVDIEHRLVMLTAQLEDCISFLTSAGGSASLDGEMKLETYLLHTLLLDPAKWAEMSCPTICSQVRLCHLKSLLDGIEERRSGGDPLKDIMPSRFRVPLTDKLSKQLRQAVDAVHSLEVVSATTDTLLQCLLNYFNTEAGSMYGSTLAEYLEWAGADAEWFPKDISLQYAYHTYHLLKSLQ